MAEILSSGQIKGLSAIFPGKSLIVSSQEKIIYGTDAGRRFAMPAAVVIPERVEQIQELMRFAGQEKLPVIPRARGTNVVGSCCPEQGGIVCSCLKLNRILDVSPQDFTALVEPGVITRDFQRHLSTLGLFYPPDPASVKISTIGGNIATCAGGMSALKYGVTRDYVLGLDMVLADGSLVSTGSWVHKNVVGLDLTRLVAGSHGTLAFIVRARLKLLPAPEETATVLLCFADDEGPVRAGSEILSRGILPRTLEYLPGPAIRCLAGYTQLPWPGQIRSALLVMVDGSRACVQASASQIMQTVSQALYKDLAFAEDQRRLWEIRRLLSPAAFSLAPDKLSEDVVVPRSSLLKAVRLVDETARWSGLDIIAFGHMGDGNLHVNIMYDQTSARQVQAAHKAREEILSQVLGLGGSISGEHGTGLAKKDHLALQLSDSELALMRGIKKVFDPESVLNPQIKL